MEKFIERRKVGFFGRLVMKDDPASSMRWIFLFSFIFINAVAWIIWASLSVAKHEMIEWPSGLVMAYSAALTVITGGKVIESKIEKNISNGNSKKEEIPISDTART